MRRMRDAPYLAALFVGLFVKAASGASATQVPQQDDADTKLKKLVDGQLAEALDAYKWFHAHPELSEKEEKTAAHFAAELRTAGWKTTERIGGYGVVAVLANGPGPTLLLRVDL